MSGEDFIESVKRRSEERGHSQMVECPGGPGEECGSHRFGVSLLARLGPKDTVGIYCAECGVPIIDADVNDAAGGVEEQIVEIQGGDE